MRRTRLASAVLCALSLLTWGGEAFAQKIALAEGTTNPDRKSFRAQDLNPLWISRADCLTKDVYTFTVTVSSDFNQLGYSLEVWATNAGGDCKTTESRMGANAICWKLASYSGITSTALDIPISVRDIVGGASAPPSWEGPGSKDADDTVCDKSSPDTPQPVLLYFLPVQGNTIGEGFIYGSSSTAQIKVDLVPPKAPSTIDVGIGDETLVLSWSQSVSADVSGYRFFCDPPPGSEGTEPVTSSLDGGVSTSTGCAGSTGTAGSSTAGTSGASGAGASGASGAGASGASGAAGASGASGAGASGASGSAGFTAASGAAGTSGSTSGSSGAAGCTVPSSACKSNVIFPGLIVDGKYECGSVAGLTATSGSTSKLKNGVNYTVAVAAVDGVGNVGALSPVACTEPAPIDTFYKVYRDAGGEGGGGFCSTGPVGETLSVGAMGFLAALGLARKLRRAKR